MTPFNIVTVSLEPGVTLIEASAGTGKTYSITGLILRLILEQQVTIREILAVTFTEAATEELRDRIRQRLQNALDDLRSRKTKDEIVAVFLKRGDVSSGIQKLDLALQSFDEAQIFTIHGFCQRMLTDHAFESGARFETALLIDPNPLFEEVARDFWRLRFYRTNPLLPVLAMAWERSPDNWVELLEQTRRHPDLVVLPRSESRSCDLLLSEIEKAFVAVTREWGERSLEIERLLRTHSSLSHDASKFRDDRVTQLLSEIAESCKGLMRAAPESLRAIEELSPASIAAGTKAKYSPPTDRFFQLCGGFQQAVEALFSQLSHDFLAYAEMELAKRKAKTNTVTYDDLILSLRDALRGKDGKILAQRIGGRYSAALIDEFQDTDPAQYEIFRTTFANGDHRLFFIGDPKQAIYGFRGADIFTYLGAKKIANREFTLTTNWRSEEPLLRGVNALFAHASEPFLLPWIQYHEVQSPSDPKVERLTGRDEDKYLNFRLLESNPDKEEGDQGKPLERIYRGLSNDIAALHKRGATIGERRLRYSDMAVLVRRGSQADEVQKTLRGQGIRSVVQTDQSVFASSEAQELQQFLQGVIDPRRDPQLKAALATALIGFDAAMLLELDQDDQKRQTWLDYFSEWRQQWLNGSFMAMFRDVVVSQNVRARIVSLAAGERRLTNFLHLAELLHDAESAGGLTPDALCSWLREQRESERVSQDRFQLRLESDEDAVQIVTIHKSKGLEYPIVFCPTLWLKAELSGKQELLFHDRDSDNSLTFDLRGKSGGAEQHAAWQSEETIAEELRLLYVAITRARNRCYIYVSERINDSPLAQLLQPPKNELPANRICTIAASCPDDIGVALVRSESRPKTLPESDEETAPTALAARPFNGNISRLAVTASFSSLNVTESELEELDANPSEEIAAPIPDESDLSILTLDRGRRTGDFFHAVLEQMDFQNLEKLSELIESKLGIYGFIRTLHRPAIHQLLEQLPEIELEPGMRLRDISTHERLSECEFCYPLAHLSPSVLAKTVGQWKTIGKDAQTRLGKLRFDPIEGFLSGFIDLFFRFKNRFYLVDWKSNWLGNRPSDYGSEGMQRAMLKHNYYLQYHLYTLAADRFLERRLPDYSYETHFGGVFYVFLRGINPSDSLRGIFRDRPALKTVESLRKLVA